MRRDVGEGIDGGLSTVGRGGVILMTEIETGIFISTGCFGLNARGTSNRRKETLSLLDQELDERQELSC